MLKDLQITKKFPLVMISFALLTSLATGIIAYSKTTSSMEVTVRENLKALLSSRKSTLEQYFDTIIHQVRFHAKSPLIINSLIGFSDAWKTLGSHPTKYLQQLYIHQNPYPKGRKNAFLAAPDNSQYSRLHQEIHPLFSNMIDTDSYYDLFLINSSGDLVYSVQKEDDFATNLLTGKWQGTTLAALFQRINASPSSGKIRMADFSPYQPSGNEPASFIGVAVYDRENQYIGAVILQLPIEPIDKIMQVTAGMGETGETYLVGPDLLMRSNSRFFQDRSILTTKVDTLSVRRAFKGETGFGVINDYRQIAVYSSFTPFSVLSIQWAMLAEIDEIEVLQPVYEMSHFLLISGLLITLVIFVFGYLLSSDIAKPIVAMTRMMEKLSDNDLYINISVDERRDEIGRMAEAMVVFKQNAIEREQLRKKLSEIVNLDALTGLYTRKYAMDYLQQLIDESHVERTKLVLMYIDLDNFKQINDSYGHHTGDKTLCNIATHLRSCVRQQDIVARIGGDEFIIIFPSITVIEDISPIANALLQNLPPQKLPITLSIGMSVFPDDAQTALTLLKNADIAMYQVKKSGKNYFCFWEQTNDAIKLTASSQSAANNDH